MSAVHHTRPFPRGALIVAAAFVGIAISAAVAVRVGIVDVAASPAALRASTHVQPIATRDLRFIDRADGAVVIEDVGKSRIATVIVPNQKTGFIRGVMRGLARERRMHGIGSEPPFRLTAWKDGELSLTDLATGRSIELNSFGTTNRASFAALLEPDGGSPRLATQ